MPPRLASVVILLYWSIATVGLVRRDLIPELGVGSPPDLRTIAAAGEFSPPVHWAVLVVDNPADPEGRRPVGQAVTESRREADGWVSMSSSVVFDSGRLLSGLFRAAAQSDRVDSRIGFDSRYRVDPSGNLRSFDAEVRMLGPSGSVWRIDGRLKGHVMEVNAVGPLVNRTMNFEYRPRGVVQSQFGPLDRLPGLQVGQRWDEQVTSPLTGQVETVRAEVKRRTVVHWNEGPVNTLEVVHTSKAASARTYVRADGLVLRQEVRLPLLRLVLERQPGPGDSQDDPAARPLPAPAPAAGTFTGRAGGHGR